MSLRSCLTKDLNESIKLVLGKNVKILFKHIVLLELKSDKLEKKVLVFSPFRLFILAAKVPTKVETHFSYLDIQMIESKRGNQMSMSVNEKVYSFICGEDSNCSLEVDTMLKVLATALRNVFPGISVEYIIRRIDIPHNRLKQVRDEDVLSNTMSKNTGPCGGFSTQYACMCDFHSMPYRDEVAWDVDTIYLSHDTRELSLKDFDHLDQKDLIPIISALEYNTWFKKLRASHIKLSHESLDRILYVLRRSISLEEVYFDNLIVKSDFVTKLSNALSSNSSIPLHSIDLSHNPIDDKGALNLSGSFSKISKGLKHLNISHCALSSKGINHVANGLNSCALMTSTLTYLNLSGNTLKDDVNNLYKFFAQPNSLSHLDVSSTDMVLDNLFGALLRGCATNLVQLNVSKNQFCAKKSKELPPSFKQFFSSALSLKYTNISQCKLPAEALKHLLLGLACNDSICEVHLDLSGNMLGSSGAHVFESCIHGVHSVSNLDISDNNFDSELASVISEISKNKSIKHLNISKNLCNMKSKYLAIVIESLVQLLQDDECVLETLILSECRLKSDAFNLINSLGSNGCLQTIDISGNLIGDSGARLLAKALQINNKLKTIYYDRNNISLLGYGDIAYALEMNYTMKYMPFPIFDANNCLKISAERTDSVMRKIQDLLNRNVMPKNHSNQNHNQAFRLQQGFLLNSTQLSLDRLVTQIQDAIKNLVFENFDSNSEINQATKLIQDADNLKHLLLHLQEVVQKKDVSNPIEFQLKKISAEMQTFFSDYLKTCTETMIEYCRNQCPNILFDKTLLNEIRKGCESKMNLSDDFIQNCFLQNSGSEITNKIHEITFSTATYLSDRISNEAIDFLNRTHSNLIEQLNQNRSGSLSNEFRSRSHVNGSRQSRHIQFSDTFDNLFQFSSEKAPNATPQLYVKRKSLNGRKLRPKSVVDTVEGYSLNDMSSLLPEMSLDLLDVPKEEKTEDCENENEDGYENGRGGGGSGGTDSRSGKKELKKSAIGSIKPLKHLVKDRPRRTKTHPSSRSALRATANEITTEALGVTEGAGTVADDGFDSFFSKNRSQMLSPTSDECSSLSFQTDVSLNFEHSGGKETPLLLEESYSELEPATVKSRSVSIDNLDQQLSFDERNHYSSSMSDSRSTTLPKNHKEDFYVSENLRIDDEKFSQKMPSPALSVKLRSNRFEKDSNSSFDLPTSPVPFLKAKTSLKYVQKSLIAKQPRPWSISDISSSATLTQPSPLLSSSVSPLKQPPSDLAFKSIGSNQNGGDTEMTSASATFVVEMKTNDQERSISKLATERKSVKEMASGFAAAAAVSGTTNVTAANLKKDSALTLVPALE